MSSPAKEGQREEDLRNQLQAAMRDLKRREPLDPTYKRYLLNGLVTNRRPVLPKDKAYKKIGSDLRAVVEAFADQTQQQSSTSSTTVVPVESRGYNPFICRTPFAIPESDTVPSRNRLYQSAVIVYNLGISHQWFSRYSPKAAAFFEISAALLSSGGGTTEESFLLRICLLNNFGVWCFENGDGDAMRTSLEHLALVLDEQPQLEHSEMVLSIS